MGALAPGLGAGEVGVLARLQKRSLAVGEAAAWLLTPIPPLSPQEAAALLQQGPPR